MTTDARKWLPRVTVATVVFDGSRYLLVEEVAEAGSPVFNQPAGHLEPGETLAEAAHRETLEETGWEVELEALLGASLLTNAITGITYYRTSFLARPLRQFATHSDEPGVLGTRWLDYAEVLANRERLRSESVLATIEQHRSGRRYPIEGFFYPGPAV
jgi:8-oxo-dGTP pyrophosphatase MutT (NUDIX family)